MDRRGELPLILTAFYSCTVLALAVASCARRVETSEAAAKASRARRALLEGADHRRRGERALARKSWESCLELAAPASTEAAECGVDLAELSLKGYAQSSTGSDAKK